MGANFADQTVIEEIRMNLPVQNNRATGNPIFCVFDGPEGNLTESLFVQPFFTAFAADCFVDHQCYNYISLWIYIKSGNLNPEWKAVRHFFGGSD